ncbi:carbohydrate ABC transporter permease, partial [Mameliella alba]
AICASLNQKRSDMITARFRTVNHASQTKSMGPDPSFRSNIDIYRDGLGLSGKFLPENYAETWKGATGTIGMAQYFKNSVIAAGVGLGVSLVFGVTSAYFSIHFAPRWRELYLRIFMVMQVVPLVLLVIPYYQAFNAFGILNSPTMVGVAYAVLALPTTVLIMQSYYVDFPKELIEAAALDGAGPYRTFFKMVLPLSFGPITAVAMMSLVFIWGETQLGVILLQDTRFQTVPVGLLQFKGQWATDLGVLFAGLSIASFPIIGLYLIFHRNLIQGVTNGGMGGR